MRSVDIRQTTVDQAEAVEEATGIPMSQWFQATNQLKVMRALLVHVGGNDAAEVGALPVLELGDYVQLGDMDEDPTSASGTSAESDSPEPSVLRPTA